MKKVSFLIFTISLLFIFSCNSSKKSTATVEENTKKEEVVSQDQNLRKMRDMANIEDLYANLELTEQQKGQFDLINDKYNKEMMMSRDENKGDWNMMRERMNDIQNRKEMEIKTILNESQFNLYKEWLAERHKSRKDRRSNKMNKQPKAD